MADHYSFDIPELDRIGSMMDDLMTAAPAEKSSHRTKTVARRRTKTSQRRRFGSWTVTQFADGMNWKNTAGFRSSLSTDSRGAFSRLGSVTLGKYSESVNWKNALDGPQLNLSTGSYTVNSGPPETVECFFDDMSFE
jgi:hypothetical protein